MKNRQNFTIKESISQTFKKICEEEGANMSKLIENFMVDYINQNNYHKTILETLESIEDVKQIGIKNYEDFSQMKPELDLTEFDNDEYKKRKLLTRIIYSINIIENYTCKIGRDIVVFMSEKYFKLLRDLILDDKVMGYKIISNDILKDYIICMKVLTEEDKMIIKVMNSAKNYGAINHKDIDIGKHHVGFKIKS
jgi:hypothetical protein